MRLNKPPKVCPVERWSSAHTTLHSGHTRILIFNVLIQLLNHGLPVLLWQCGVMAFWPSPSSTWRLCWVFYWSPSPKSLISPKSWPTLLAWPSEHSSPTPCFSLYQRCVRDERFNQTDEAQYCVLHSKVFFYSTVRLWDSTPNLTTMCTMQLGYLEVFTSSTLWRRFWNWLCAWTMR